MKSKKTEPVFIICKKCGSKLRMDPRIVTKNSDPDDEWNNYVCPVCKHDDQSIDPRITLFI
jgi:Zn finger protein HypA/HybF involved in hydrogenase expression